MGLLPSSKLFKQASISGKAVNATVKTTGSGAHRDYLCGGIATVPTIFQSTLPTCTDINLLRLAEFVSSICL